MAFAYCRRKQGSGATQKRLRVDTQSAQVATTASALYLSANIDVVRNTAILLNLKPARQHIRTAGHTRQVLALLTHKIALASNAEGVAEGAKLLTDWFQRLLQLYRKVRCISAGSFQRVQLSARRMRLCVHA
jgi:hypothetical protein